MTPWETFQKWKEDWTPDVFAVVRRNVSAETLAKIVYEEQCRYVGSNHEGYCRLVLAHFFSNLIEGLASDIKPTKLDSDIEDEK